MIVTLSTNQPRDWDPKTWNGFEHAKIGTNKVEAEYDADISQGLDESEVS